MEKDKKFYITTPIYYSSGNLHIGHCYTTVICDAIARFKRMSGYDVFYLTGTDEHGQKVEQKALAAGKTPQQFVDDLYENIVKLWKLLDISYDKFIRTTDEYHVKAIQKIFKQLLDNGDLYKSEYEGLYCTPCEAFWTESQLVDGRCPDCGREVKPMKEESYFFRLSKYSDRLQQLYRENPDFIAPKSRMNEMINNFIKPGLKDLCVSRTSFKWGIPVPFDDGHIVYVWVDALSNYITALGAYSDDTTLFDRYWPADLHMVGKEIVRFHTIIWPAILMSLGLELPKQVYGHGWLLFGGDKMSKSKGNIADPTYLCERYGVDAIRYYLLREVPFGSDGVYTTEMLLHRINADLANVYGNLVSRTLAMITQYFGGEIPAPTSTIDEMLQNENDKILVELGSNLLKQATLAIDKLDAPKALDEIFKLLNAANKYVDDTAPWTLNKSGDKARLATVMYNLAESVRIATVLLQPFITSTPNKVFEAFGTPENLRTFDSVAAYGGTVAGTHVEKIAPLFARIDIEKELEHVDGKVAADAQKKEEEQKKENKQVQKTETKAANEAAGKEERVGVADISEITIEDFKRITLKVGEILTCEKVEKADKLLKFTINTGEKVRTIVSSIAEYYKAEEMVGKNVVVVANLKPAKFRGIVSEGMLLCAIDGDDLCLVAPERKMPGGSTVC